jgi:hypothetical protein
MPEKLVRALLLRNIVIQPGLETNNPLGAVQRYIQVFSEHGLSLKAKRVMVFGYGGRFDIGFGLLKAGAAHTVLCDKYAPADEAHNRRLFEGGEKYFTLENGKLRPRPEWITLLESDIRNFQVDSDTDKMDFVVSSSVYEHVDDVEGITHALASLTKTGGTQIHFVDLRDHFFKYPFEMLRFSENTWRKWLNPSSNHNRYRLWNYRSAFEACFERVEIKILFSEENAFRKLLPHIRPEFISNNMDENYASLILVIASNPKR